jgi:hypothetical protein
MLHLEKFKRIYFKEQCFWNVADGDIVIRIVNEEEGGRCILSLSYRSVQIRIKKNKLRKALFML